MLGVSPISPLVTLVKLMCFSAVNLVSKTLSLSLAPGMICRERHALGGPAFFEAPLGALQGFPYN